MTVVAVAGDERAALCEVVRLGVGDPDDDDLVVGEEVLLDGLGEA